MNNFFDLPMRAIALKSDAYGCFDTLAIVSDKIANLKSDNLSVKYKDKEFFLYVYDNDHYRFIISIPDGVPSNVLINFYQNNEIICSKNLLVQRIENK